MTNCGVRLTFSHGKTWRLYIVMVIAIRDYFWFYSSFRRSEQLVALALWIFKFSKSTNLSALTRNFYWRINPCIWIQCWFLTICAVYFQIWRFLLCRCTFLDPRDALCAAILIYHFRIFERRYGSLKYAVSFVLCDIFFWFNIVTFWRAVYL